MGLELRLLGETCACVEGRAIDLGPAKQRAVLAVLMADVNRAVTLDQLADRLWGEHPPHRAAGTLRSYLSRLRTALAGVEGCGIRRDSLGYVLQAEETAVDLYRFRRLLAQARASEDDEHAAARFERALALWHGGAEPLAGIDTPWATATRATLQAERLAGRLDHHEVRLRQGQHAALLPALASLAAEHPLDERLAGQFLLALYRSGRQADALAHYERLRLRLADELGADPSPTLKSLHRQILTADPVLAAPTPAPAPAPAPVSAPAPAPAPEPAAAPPACPPPPPRQLPAPPPLFTGRARELDTLDQALSADRTAVISAIGGYGGIGKTWLALHWAHQHLDRFPDGQLYVNLRGFDPSDAPMPPEVAVRTLLDALTVDPTRIPADLNAQAAMYRGLVADKRMLILLDNARDTAQVLPLLPGGSSCTVLVTSRNQLAGLVTGHGAHPVALGTLDRFEARRLLTRHLGPGRLQTEPEAVADLLDHCGGLPLALGIVAARATMRPDFPLAVLAGELRSDATRLDALDAGELTADLRAVFSWSYRTLTPEAARLFRLLGIHPGHDISRSALASLTGLTLAETRTLLAELVRAHLITEHAPGRYTLHDLLRTYATEQAHAHDPEPERDAALHRLLDHYLRTAHAAALDYLQPRNPITPTPALPGVTPLELATRQEALAWFAAEHTVLMAAIRRAADAGFGVHSWQLAWTLVEFVDRQGRWHDLIKAARFALAASQRNGDQVGQVYAHRGLVRAFGELSHFDEAREHLGRMLDLVTGLGDRQGQAITYLLLGWVAEAQDRYDESLSHAERSLELFTAVADRSGRARALNSVGYAHALLGHHRQALFHCRQALELHQEFGDRYGQAATWDSLGYAHHHLGHHAQAIECYEKAVQLIRETGYYYNGATALIHLADTYQAIGDAQAARDARQAALDILDEYDLPADEHLRTKLRASLA
jgi:DNA-binding SARP family transcriptional activator/tetratricopeptide (TPR) repeat protein